MPDRRRVLLVEDHSAARAMLERALLADGFDVITAVDAEEALEIVGVAGSHIALAVVDAVLPTPGSAAVLEALRRSMRPLRVLVVSGWGESAIRASGFLSSVEHKSGYRFLSKPFSLAALSSCVEELLAGEDDTIDVVTGEWTVPSDRPNRSGDRG